MNFCRSLLVLCLCMWSGVSHSSAVLYEGDLPSTLRIHAIAGAGPEILDCRLTAKATLACRTDRKLKEVRCTWSHVANNRGETAQLLKRKLERDLFVCDRPRGVLGEGFSQAWRIFLSAEDGTLSEWWVEGVSGEQAERALKLEGIVQQEQESVVFGNMRTFVGARIPQAAVTEKSFQFGADLLGRLNENFWLNAELFSNTISLSQFSQSYDVAIGMVWNPFHYFPARIGLKYENAGRFFTAKRVTSLNSEVGVEWETGWLRTTLAPSFELRWRNVNTFRESYALGLTMALRLWGRLYLEAKASYESELWFDEGSDVDLRGIGFRLGALWR